MSELWWRNTWLEAVWSSDLRNIDKLVAAVYADHARDKRTTFVTLNRLCDRASLSRDSANRAVRSLVLQGWLVSTGTAKPRQPVFYTLTIPDITSTSPVPVTSTGDVPETDSTSTAPDITSTAPDITSAGDVLNQRSYQKTHQSLSRGQQLVREHLGCSETDERLMLIGQILKDRAPDSPAAWTRSVIANGDLEDLLDKQKEKTKTVDMWTAPAVAADHAFEPDGSSPSCGRCGLPAGNGRHFKETR